MQSIDDTPEQTEAERLNEHCTCLTLDKPSVARTLAHQLDDNANEVLSSTACHQFFSNAAVFVPDQALGHMLAIVQALEVAAALPDYRQRVLAWAPQNAQINPGRSKALPRPDHQF